MVDNFEQIRRLLKFRNDDEFYYIQIIQRRKDEGNSELRRGQREIRNYIVRNLEYFDQIKNEVIDLAKKNNARAYINLNPKSHKKVAHEMLINLSKLLYSEQYKSAGTLYASTCSQSKPNRKDATWIIDIDEEDIEKLQEHGLVEFEQDLLNCPPFNTTKIIGRVPSKTGIHLITSVFDQRELKQKYPWLEIKKNSVTNLYIP
jgi:hypothetical protein